MQNILIDVSWNEFEEYIPQCFESLVELRLIVLESNKLSGPLFNTTPLVLLNTLIVTDNKLSGSLPISQMGWSDESTLYEHSFFTDIDLIRVTRNYTNGASYASTFAL